MFKIKRPTNFLSLLFLLIAGVLFVASCRKPNSISSESPQPSSIASRSTNLLESGSTEALQVFTMAGNGTPGLVNAQGTTARFNNPSGIAVDASGNVYVADKDNHVIRKMTPTGEVTTLAGSGAAGYLDGAGSTAQFNNPSGIAMDASGNIYVADAGNHVIRKISAQGVVATLAGIANFPGSNNGPGTAAKFSNPLGVALDTSNNVLVADANNHMIRKITPDGFVTLVAGTGTAGSADGSLTFSQFNNPSGIAVDRGNNVYVADAGNNKIRKIVRSTVSTMAGNNSAGLTDGLGTAAQFNNPTGIAVDTSGNLWIADKSNHAIRMVTASGAVSTLAGNGTATFVDGQVSLSRFNSPAGIAIDASGKLFVADQNNHRVRRIAPGTVITPGTVIVSTLAGNGVAGFVNGVGTAAQFSRPVGLSAHATGTGLLVTEYGNHTVRNISFSTLEVSTVLGFSGIAGYINGVVSSALFNRPASVVSVPLIGLFVSDMFNNSIRGRLGNDVWGFAGSQTPGFVDGPGSNARFNNPSGMAADLLGNLYVADFYNHCIRKITPSGFVSTLAGGTGAGFADGQGTAAKFYEPFAVAVDASGNIYVGEWGNNRIRKITPSGFVTTLAGSTRGFENGTGAAAKFNGPHGVAVDALNNVYVADLLNHVVRKITPSGEVSTLAGTGVAGYRDGAGDAAMFRSPAGIAVDPLGNIFVSDSEDNRIRKISIQ